MSEFQVNTDMFGWYVSVPTDFCGRNHIYKVVGRISSNAYCDTPILATSEPKIHKEIVPVLNVIHCGVHEDKVVRVALSDCEIISESAPVRHGQWENYPNSKYRRCSACKVEFDKPRFGFRSKYCPNCGACMNLSDTYVGDMEGTENERL